MLDSSRSTRSARLQEGVDRLEEADALGAVVHRHDELGAEAGGDRGGLLGADGRAAADGDEEQVDLRRAPRACSSRSARLAEVAEVRDAQAAEA